MDRVGVSPAVGKMSIELKWKTTYRISCARGSMMLFGEELELGSSPRASTAFGLVIFGEIV